MTNKTKKTYSFAPGLQKISLCEQKTIKIRLYQALGVNNRHDFCRKKHGIVNISKIQYDAVTSIFSDYGIEESDVWLIKDCL